MATTAPVRADAKSATLYRMATDKHLCPFGLKAKDLLEREGYAVEDHLLTTRAEPDAFEAEHDVKTTPQVWLGERRVGGYTVLLGALGKEVAHPDATTDTPIVAIFGLAAAKALAASWVVTDAFVSVRGAELFVDFSTCLLALGKLRDVEGFINGFLGYDLLARRVVR